MVRDLEREYSHICLLSKIQHIIKSDKQKVLLDSECHRQKKVLSICGYVKKKNAILKQWHRYTQTMVVLIQNLLKRDMTIV